MYMMNGRYELSVGYVYNIICHLLWCPKYRQQALVGDVATSIENLIRQKANQIGMRVEAVEISSDHIAILVLSKPTCPVHYIVQQFEGLTSLELRK